MQRARYIFRARDKTISLGERTAIMGVVNVTPDSFSDGGRYLDPERAVEGALGLLEAGADLIDIGGESSRPGAQPVSVAVELDRIAPVLERLRPLTSAVLSIDTHKPEVARACLEMGADVINDITALRSSAEMGQAVATCGAGLVLMHMRGNPVIMQQLPPSPDILGEISADLQAAVSRARAAGVEEGRIMLDPGIGFGKTFEDNLLILNRLPFFAELGLPILVGHSRKAFLGKILGLPPGERLMGTAAAAVVAAMRGAHVLRVHDVREIRQCLDVADSILSAADNILFEKSEEW